MKIADILDILNGIAPFEKAEDYDNVGLLVGRSDRDAVNILFTLDMTRAVLKEAKERGAELIVAHHPVMFRGTKELTDRSAAGDMLLEMAESGIAYIAMHTNYDAMPDGVNECLARTLGAGEMIALESGLHLFDTGDVTFAAFCDRARESLRGAVRAYGDGDRIVRRAAVMGGSGASYAAEALENGADVFLTGEISYHKALELSEEGLCVAEAGHYETERGAVKVLAERVRLAAGGQVRMLLSRSLDR